MKDLSLRHFARDTALSEADFALYSESHQNAVNKQIHNACVPVIYASIIGMLQVAQPLGVPLSLPVVAVLAGYYFRFFYDQFVPMLLLSTGALGFAVLVESMGLPLLAISVLLFLIAWVGQFVGHHIEGKKPSFLNDLKFLLVGPAWVVRHLQRSK